MTERADDNDLDAEPRRVAIVDADPRYLRAVRRTFTPPARGCELVLFTSGEEILRHGVSGLDLIVIDLFMPGISGLETCRTLRAESIDHRPPIVLATRQVTADIATAARTAGATRILAKPYDLNAIVGSYRALCRHRVGDMADRGWLITDHLGLARRLAAKFTRRFWPLIDLADAEVLAFAGLCRAAHQFPAECPDQFADFAVPGIRDSILIGLHPLGERQAQQVARAHAIAAAQWDLAYSGIDPADEVVAACLHISIEDIVEIYGQRPDHE
ncbi:MAG: response regulator [Kofleriaceae bacterium]